MKKTAKTILKYILINFTMFTICFLLFSWEKAEVSSNVGVPQYISVAFFFFLIIMALYLPIYGCASYVSFRKIIIPNIILYFFLTTFFVLLYFYFDVFTLSKTLLNSFKVCFVTPMIGLAFSCSFSLITKFVLYLSSKNE